MIRSSVISTKSNLPMLFQPHASPICGRFVTASVFMSWYTGARDEKNHDLHRRPVIFICQKTWAMNKTKVPVFLLVIVAIFLAGCAPSRPLPVEKQADQVFATGLDPARTEWKLDVYAPREAGDWPAVVILPGWAETKEMMASLGRSVAERGARVYIIDYPRIEQNEAIFNYGRGYRQQAEITACAVRMARSQTVRPDSRITPLILAGADYGGGLAAHAALYGANIDHRWEGFGASRGGPLRQVQCAVNQGSSHVDTLVGIAGNYEPFVGYEGASGREFIEPRDPELWAFLSRAVGENPKLKVRLLHARDDPVVPYNSAATFKSLLSGAGYDVTLENYEGEHAPTPLEPAAKFLIAALK